MTCSSHTNNCPTNNKVGTTEVTKKPYNKTSWVSCGIRYVYDGEGISTETVATLPNGVYNQFTLENGCITSATTTPLPIYTPPPCIPVGLSGSGGSGNVAISPNTSNLTTLAIDGLYTTIYTDATLSGDGTINNPLKVVGGSGGGSGGSTSVVAGQGTTVTSIGGAYSVSIAKSPLPSGTYNGITFNSLGIATAYSNQNNPSIVGVTAGNDIQASVTSNVATVGLSTTDASSNTWVLGGFNIKTTSGGRVDKAEQTINLGQGQGLTLTYIDPSDGLVKKMNFNAYGSLMSIAVENATNSKPIIQQFLRQYNIYFTP
jgi:hypothetical protein